MANEATKVELTNSTGHPIMFKVADAQAIPKGTLLVMDADRRVIPHTAINTIVVGIAAMEKKASDGSTSVSAYTSGIFEFVSSAAITRGHKIKASSVANQVEAAAAADVTHAEQRIIGVALSTAASDKVVAKINL